MITRSQFGTLAALEASGEAIVNTTVELERAHLDTLNVSRMIKLGLLEISHLGSLELVQVSKIGRAEMINWLARRQ